MRVNSMNDRVYSVLPLWVRRKLSKREAFRFIAGFALFAVLFVAVQILLLWAWNSEFRREEERLRRVRDDIAAASQTQQRCADITTYAYESINKTNSKFIHSFIHSIYFQSIRVFSFQTKYQVCSFPWRSEERGSPETKHSRAQL